MINSFQTIAALVVLVCVCQPCSYPQQNSVDESHAMLDDISVMFEEPFAESSPEIHARLIKFAEDSDQVSVIVYSEFCPIFQFGNVDERHSQVLLAHYIAGSVKFDLEHPEEAVDRYADIPSAVKATLEVYRKIRVRDKELSVEFFDKLDAKDQEGMFDTYILGLIEEYKNSPEEAGRLSALK